MNGMDRPDARLVDLLCMADTLDVYRLRMVIDRLLDDPKRILAIRTRMHQGQAVRYLGTDGATMRDATVLQLKDRTVTLRDVASGRMLQLPYAAIEPPAVDGTAASARPPPAAIPRRPGRADFGVGDRVSFDDRYLQPQVGVIVRINQRTATIDTGGGQSWRVSFGLLRRVLDTSDGQTIDVLPADRRDPD